MRFQRTNKVLASFVSLMLTIGSDTRRLVLSFVDISSSYSILVAANSCILGIFFSCYRPLDYYLHTYGLLDSSFS